jgi:hypothetical protein
MINPYRPPKAAVALPTTPDVLPGAVRALRALAVVGSLFLMLISVLAIVATRPRGAELIVMLGLSAVAIDQLRRARRARARFASG